MKNNAASKLNMVMKIIIAIELGVIAYVLILVYF